VRPCGWVDALDALEAAAYAAELAGAGCSTNAAPDPADEHLSTEDARAMLEALDAEARVVGLYKLHSVDP
jgi:NAD(P)H-hydrate repair Nnr-like enzyme with NAD(P)H-hydrate dehydratase domain